MMIALGFSVAFLISFVFWKRVTLFVLYWVVIVGAIRKWALPGMGDILFFSTHALLSGVYCRYFLLQRGAGSPRWNMGLLFAVWMAWGAISMLNPRLPDWRIALIGYVVHFYFVPLLFIVPRVFATTEQLVRFLRVFCWTSLPLLVLGIVQYISPVDSVINRYVSESLNVARVGEHARVTSTFSYISGYTSYLGVLLLLQLYLLVSAKSGRFAKFVTSIIILLSIVNLLMTGSRGPVVLGTISAVLYMISLMRLGLSFAGKNVMKLLILFGIMVFLANAFYAARDSFEAFSQRTAETSGDVLPRLVDTFTPFKFLEQAGMTGYGIGTTYQGAARFEVDWGDMPRFFEEEPERIVLELGLPGFILTYWIRFLIPWQFWRLYLRLRTMDLKLLALTCLLLEVPYLFGMTLSFNHTSGIFYWFFASFLLLLPRLEAAPRS
jgi:hypothetical protein